MTEVSEVGLEDTGYSENDYYRTSCDSINPAHTRPVNLKTKVVETVASQIMGAFYFPIKNSPAKQEQLKKEQLHFHNFWHKESLDPGYPEHAQVREAFDKPKNTRFTVKNIREMPVTVTCNVIESKDSANARTSNSYINGLYVTGNHSTIDTPTANLIPLFTSLNTQLDSSQKGRIVLFSFYNILDDTGNKYYPKSVDDMGVILGNVMDAMNKEYGSTDYCVAHSLGGIGTVSVMQQMLRHPEKDFSFFPKVVCLHNAPTSIWEASRNVWRGRLLYPLVRGTGCALDLEGTIDSFHTRYEDSLREKNASLIIVNVLQDHYFPGRASLCKSEKILGLKERGQLISLEFDWAQHEHHENAHHGLSLKNCYHEKLVSEKDKEEGHLLPGEHVVDLLIRKVVEAKKRMEGKKEDAA